MRKRSKYRPRPLIPNPIEWVIQGLKPLAAAEGHLVMTRIKNHDALNTIRTGAGTRRDVDMLIGAANMTSALVKMYARGADYADEVRMFQDAVYTMAQRGAERDRFIFTGPELSAVNAGMEVHDAQLAITNVGEIEAAIHHVRKLQRTGSARRIIKKVQVAA
jgi:hypothetical protein